MKKMFIVTVILLLAVVIAGCQSKSSLDELISQGRDVFRDKCVACHTINGQGGKRGPDLTKIGLTHDRGWLNSYLENPYSVKPDSAMPQINLSADEIDKLTTFLDSLK